MQFFFDLLYNWTMPLSKEFIKLIEVEYLKAIARLLKNNQMNAARAKESAQAFLRLIPFSNYEDLEIKIKTFVEQYPELKHLEIMVLKNREEQKTKLVIDKMQTLMHNNQIDDAIQVAKQ